MLAVTAVALALAALALSFASTSSRVARVAFGRRYDDAAPWPTSLAPDQFTCVIRRCCQRTRRPLAVAR